MPLRLSSAARKLHLPPRIPRKALQKSYRRLELLPFYSTRTCQTRFGRQNPHPFRASCNVLGIQNASGVLAASRSTSSIALSSQKAAISTDRYHKLADAYIDVLVGILEEVQETREEVDCEYSAGVLTLAFPPNGTYVLNKQPPNKQIWLSSPVSGPKRYDYVINEGDGEDGVGDWVYLRDRSTLSSLLEGELGIVLQRQT